MSTIMKAKEAADALYGEIGRQVEAWKAAGHSPAVAAVLVEGDPASVFYAKAKRKVADRLGISFELYSFREASRETELIRLIERLNEDPGVHGIMLELPLPKHLDAKRITRAIAPKKDVDGVTPGNQWATMAGEPGLYPATPQACIRLLKHYGFTLEGRNVTLVGRGQTVGMPLFHMLQREQATVTVCHSRTPDLASHLRHAEIAFAAVGRPGMITKEMVHSDLVLIDAGINETEAGGITGDAAPDLSDRVRAVSPVPGGVGTLTTAVLFENVLKAMELQLGKGAGL